MKDNNTLIAEFMGLKDGAKYFSPTLEVAESVGLGMHIYPDEMRYHISWDWLRPVVLEIEVNQGGVPDQLMDVSLYSEIGEVHQAVVEFIREYNLTPKEVV